VSTTPERCRRRPRRQSSIESFPLFGYGLRDYDELYAEKLDLLLAIDRNERVIWQGRFRHALQDAEIVPRPDSGHLPIWLGTGGNPRSLLRAGQLGLPIAYGIIGGQPHRFAQLAELYLRAAHASRTAEANIKVSAGSPGFIGDDGPSARDAWWREWHETMTIVGRRRGFPPPPRAAYDLDTSPGGAVFVGSPEEVAERIVALHGHLGHMSKAICPCFASSSVACGSSGTKTPTTPMPPVGRTTLTSAQQLGLAAVVGTHAGVAVGATGVARVDRQAEAGAAGLAVAAEAAADVEGENDAVADGEGDDAVADLDDLPDVLVAEHLALLDVGPALVHVQVAPADVGGGDADDDVGGSFDRCVRDVGDRDVEGAVVDECVHADGLLALAL